MPSRVWSHICEYATTDASNKAYIMGEFDIIYAASLPARHPMFFVISKWVGFSGESFTLKVTITSPGRVEVANSSEINVVIPGGAKGEGQYIATNGFIMSEFNEFGEHAVEFILDGYAIHYLPLTIIQR